MIMPSLLAAAALALLGAAPPPFTANAAYPDSLYRAIAKDDQIPDCARSAGEDPVEYVRTHVTIGTQRLNSGATVFTATSKDSCVCSDGNCFITAFVRDGADSYREIFSAGAVSSSFHADGTVSMKQVDGPTVSAHSAFRFDGRSYQQTGSYRTFDSTGEKKPDQLWVYFAPGAYSATERGSVRENFGDDYTLTATAGQTMSVVVTPLSGKFDAAGVRVYDIADSNRGETDLKGSSRSLSWTGTLRDSGSYDIAIEGASETPSRYSMTIDIH